MENESGRDGQEMYACGAGGASDHGTKPQDRETPEAAAAATAAAGDGGSCLKKEDLNGMNHVDDDDFKAALRTELSGLQYVRRSATFDTFNESSPDLFVKGIGALSMPLSELHAAQIKEKIRREEGQQEAEPAAEDPVNERNLWFIDGDHLRIRNPRWESFMTTLCRQVASELGIRGGNTSLLYSKLSGMFVGGKGSLLKFDAEIRRSEPIFGRLIVTLPSSHEGGDVAIKHAGRTASFKLEAFQQSYIGWCLDSALESSPLLSGHRFMLVYDLAVTGLPVQPTPSVLTSGLQDPASELRHVLNQWVHHPLGTDSEGPPYLLYRLSGSYNNLSSRTPKNEDWNLVQHLRSMTGELPFFIFLAALNKEERGSRLLSETDGHDMSETNSDDDDDSEVDFYGAKSELHYYGGHCEEGYVTLDDVDHLEIQILRLFDLDGHTIGKEIKISENCLTDVHENFFDEEPNEYEYEEGYGTHLHDAKALLLLPHSSVSAFFAGSDPSVALEYMVRSYRKPLTAASDFIATVKTLCERLLATTRGFDALGPWITRRLLEMLLDLNEEAFFNQVCRHIKGNLDLNFFSWVRENWPGRGTSFKDIEDGLFNAATGYPTPNQRCLAMRPFISARTDGVAAGDQEHQLILSWARRIFDGALEFAMLQDLTRDDGVMLLECAFLFSAFDDMFNNLVVPFLRKNTEKITFMLGALHQISRRIKVLNAESASAYESPAKELAAVWLSLSRQVVHRLDITAIASPLSYFVRDSVQMPPYDAGSFAREAQHAPSLVILEPRHLSDFVTAIADCGGDREILFPLALQIAYKARFIHLGQFPSFWVPFLHELLRWRSLPVSSPRYQHLFGALLEAYIEKCMSENPAPGREMSLPPTTCQCYECTSLNVFLQDPSTDTIRIIGRPVQENHIRRNLSLQPCHVQGLRFGRDPTAALIISKISKVGPEKLESWTAGRESVKAQLALLDVPQLRLLLGESYSPIINAEYFRSVPHPPPVHGRFVPQASYSQYAPHGVHTRQLPQSAHNDFPTPGRVDSSAVRQNDSRFTASTPQGPPSAQHSSSQPSRFLQPLSANHMMSPSAKQADSKSSRPSTWRGQKRKVEPEIIDLTDL